MTDLLPHTEEPLVDPDLTASYEMRAWMESLEGYTYVEPSGSITTDGDMFLRLASVTAVTLDASPGDGDSVAIYIDGGVYSTVTDGTETDTFVEDGVYLTYTYVADASQWVRGR